MADKCSKCCETIDPVSDKDMSGTCCDCAGRFHAKCCSAKVWQAWTKRNAKRELWKCDSCKLETASSQSKSDNEATGNSAVLSVLNDLRKEIAVNHQDTKARFDGLDQSINSLRESVEESKRRINALEEDNAKLKVQLASNRAKMEENSANMKKMRSEIQDLQQYSRRNNLEIKGIPQTHGENIYTILERIARVLDVPWAGGEISVAHRLRKPETGPPAIVVAFVCRNIKEMWLTAAKNKKLDTTDLSPKLSPGPVYINSHLTSHNKQLLGRARKLVRDRKLASAWTVDEKVLVRKMSGGPGIRVFEMDDLDKIIG